MRLLIAFAFSTALLFSQTAAKPITPTPKVPVKVVVPDRERAEFLLLQRDWIAIQRQYDDAFKREPSVVKYNAETESFQKMCQDAGMQFDLKTVQCQDIPKPEPAKPAQPKPTVQPK